MNWLKIALIAAGVLIIAVIAFGWLSNRWFYQPTTGARIAQYTEPQSALLIVDVQEGITGTQSKEIAVARSEPLLATINQLVEAAGSRKMPVIYIGLEFDNNFINRIVSNGLVAGQPGTMLDKRLKVINSTYFPKNRSDSFCNPALYEYLAANQVQKLYVVGFAAQYCVYNTAVGGTNRGYDAIIITDATEIRGKLSRDEISEMYRKAGISTITSIEFLKR